MCIFTTGYGQNKTLSCLIDYNLQRSGRVKALPFGCCAALTRPDPADMIQTSKQSLSVAQIPPYSVNPHSNRNLLLYPMLQVPLSSINRKLSYRKISASLSLLHAFFSLPSMTFIFRELTLRACCLQT